VLAGFVNLGACCLDAPELVVLAGGCR